MTPKPTSPKINKNGIFAALVLAMIFITAVSAYSLGYQAGVARPVNINIDELSNIEQPEESEPKTDFSIFWEVWDELREKHPDFETVDKQDLVYGAVRGLTDALGDPNTMFFDPEDSERFDEDISGHFTGIGVELDMKDDQLVVVTPLVGSPGDKAGLLPGDIIVAIDGESAGDIGIDEAVKKIRGPRGSTVVLTIRTNGNAANREVSIVRDNIEVPSIESKMIEDNLLYIRIYNFSANTPILFYTEMLKYAFTNIEGVVLDLRNNPGGFLDVGIDAAGWFTGADKLIVTELFSSGEKEEFYSTGSGIFDSTPLVVLVNKGSASAAEILAGAIKYYQGAKLVGTQTFGKGTVQQLDHLSDGSSIKITIAHWLLPDGSLIEGLGITPDIVIEQGEEDILDGTDTQLQKAIQTLKESL
ncbi:MAG: S41 family peptidase [Candidatus Colwellbacteria bacterium]|nr:S41 family peptidase [Candidatus Colwellbacteria bacterium]